MSTSPKPKAFTVEIYRVVEVVNWATVAVYAATPEEAHALAQAKAAELNGLCEFDIPISWSEDDGSPGDWAAAKPGEEGFTADPDPMDLDCAAETAILGEPPADDDSDLAEASEGFTCGACGRPEHDCSADPCAAVQADREA